MSDEIRIQRSTLGAFGALLLALVAGGYLVFGAGADSAGSSGSTTATVTGGNSGQPAQDVYIKALGGYYDKQEVSVKKGTPVRLHFSAASDAGCGRQMVIYGMNVRVVASGDQESVVEFTPQKEGTYEFNCGMRMFRPGRFIVTA